MYIYIYIYISIPYFSGEPLGDTYIEFPNHPIGTLLCVITLHGLQTPKTYMDMFMNKVLEIM